MRKRNEPPLGQARPAPTIPVVAGEPVERRPTGVHVDPALADAANGLLPPSAEPRAASWFAWSTTDQPGFPDEWTTPEVDGTPVAPPVDTELAHRGPADEPPSGGWAPVVTPVDVADITTAEAAGWLPDRPAPPGTSWVRVVAGFMDRAPDHPSAEPRDATTPATAWPSPSGAERTGPVPGHTPRPHPSALWPPAGPHATAVRDAMALHPSARGAGDLGAPTDLASPHAPDASRVVEQAAPAPEAPAPEAAAPEAAAPDVVPVPPAPVASAPETAAPEAAAPEAPETVGATPTVDTAPPDHARPRPWTRDLAGREAPAPAVDRAADRAAGQVVDPADLVQRIERGAALSMNEDQLQSLTRRALRRIVPDGAATLLALAPDDTFHAHLTTGDEVERFGGSACEVRERRMCPALVGGQALRFDRSDELDACPSLVTEQGPACAAVCVPVIGGGPLQGVLVVRTRAGAPCGAETTGLLQRTVDAVAARMAELRALDA